MFFASNYGRRDKNDKSLRETKSKLFKGGGRLIRNGGPQMEDNDAALYEIFNAGIVRCNLRCKESLNEV